MHIGSIDDTRCPQEGEGTLHREHSEPELPSFPPTAGHSGRQILPRNGSSLRRRRIEPCNEIHGEFIPPEADRSL
jgi:hypothetical protein